MKERIIQLTISLFLAVLAGDILYLYGAGGWAEPNKLILLSEFTILLVFLIGGFGNALRSLVYLLWRQK